MFKIDQLSCGYGQSQILHDLDLNVAKREIVAVMGRNGIFQLHVHEVESRLQALQINPDDLLILGTLYTKRAEINYKGGLLVFDHSQYAEMDDYELEYEVSDEESGKMIFENFLILHSIPRRPADKKTARFMSAVNKKRGF